MPAVTRSASSSVHGDDRASPKRPWLSSTCLWLLIAPFDTEQQQLPFTRLHLWPYLEDRDGLRACCVNRATLQHYGSFPMHRWFFLWQREMNMEVRNSDLRCVLDNVVCFPAVKFLCCYDEDCEAQLMLMRALPRLRHLRRLFLLSGITTSIDGLLPASLQGLILYDSVPLTERTFPAGLHDLTLTGVWRETGCQPTYALTPGVLPSSLRSLHYETDQPITCGLLPSSLQSLYITREVELEPGCLPPSLRLLSASCKLHIARGVLPAGLRALSLYDEIPPLDALPPELKTLRLHFIERPFTARSLPASVISMELTYCRFALADALPASLRRLRINGPITQLATSFTGCSGLQTLDLRYAQLERIPVGCLPPSLTSLLLPKWICDEELLVGSLPAGLQRLSQNGCYSYRFQHGLLPAGLRWLQLCRCYNCPLAGSLPSSLRQLRIGSGDIDNSVRHLFNQSFLDVFGQDSQLRILRIDCSAFVTPLAPLSLPPRLQELNLSGTDYDTAFTTGILPSSLLRLRLGAKYEQRVTTDSFDACHRLRELDLSLCCRFRHPLTGVLPASLQLLRLHRAYPMCHVNRLSSSICVTTIPPMAIKTKAAAGWGN